MTKIVQLAGGNAAQQNAYVGPERELTVDESNNDLRLHDGVTPGGFPIQSRDNADERYQPKNPELSGLDFLPEAKGFAVRLGPGDYVLRSITVNGANLEISYGNGYAGSPFISLADTIETEHTWLGQQLFNETVQFNAGIIADVEGDTEGTHTGPVIGDTAGTHTGATNGTHTGPTVGNVDVRGATLLLDDDQIPMAKVNGLTEAIETASARVGFIVLWSGAIIDIPTGWFLCNGLNGTPDLRGLFVIGANDSTLPPGTEGGSALHAHSWTHSGDGTHDHGITVDGHTLTTSEIPSHSHQTVANVSTAYNTLATYPDKPMAKGATGGSSGSSYDLGSDGATDATLGKSSNTGSGGSHSHGLTVVNDGAHSHALETPDLELYPPFYALCYIMRGA